MNKRYFYITIGGVLILAWYISTYWYQLMLIQGDSMLPSYHNLQLVVIDKHDVNYYEGDVIAFRCEKLDAILVKRIVESKEEGFYVLGDNREHSIDSRDERVGLVQKSTIIGKVL